MGKQTMGTPAHALKHRGSDNKLYRIQYTQAPLVQNRSQRDYMMDEYPQVGFKNKKIIIIIIIIIKTLK